MEIINISNINEVRKLILKLKKTKSEEKIAVLSQDDEFNRKILETKGVNILIINEETPKKDYLKQRNSGLNEVLCKIAKKNNISIAIDIKKIISKNTLEKARSLSRLAQNIELAKRLGTKLIFLLGDNKTDKKALNSLLLSLKASTKQAMESF